MRREQLHTIGLLIELLLYGRGAQFFPLFVICDNNNAGSHSVIVEKSKDFEL
jgi:hypothetical protein